MFESGFRDLTKMIIALIVVIGVAMFLIGKYLF